MSDGVYKPIFVVVQILNRPIKQYAHRIEQFNLFSIKVNFSSKNTHTAQQLKHKGHTA